MGGGHFSSARSGPARASKGQPGRCAFSWPGSTWSGVQRRVRSFPGGASAAGSEETLLFGAGPSMPVHARPCPSRVDGEPGAAALLSPRAWAQTQSQSIGRTRQGGGERGPRGGGSLSSRDSARHWGTPFRSWRLHLSPARAHLTPRRPFAAPGGPGRAGPRAILGLALGGRPPGTAGLPPPQCSPRLSPGWPAHPARALLIRKRGLSAARGKARPTLHFSSDLEKMSQESGWGWGDPRTVNMIWRGRARSARPRAAWAPCRRFPVSQRRLVDTAARAAAPQTLAESPRAPSNL